MDWTQTPSRGRKMVMNFIISCNVQTHTKAKEWRIPCLHRELGRLLKNDKLHFGLLLMPASQLGFWDWKMTIFVIWNGYMGEMIPSKDHAFNMYNFCNLTWLWNLKWQFSWFVCNCYMELVTGLVIPPSNQVVNIVCGVEVFWIGPYSPLLRFALREESRPLKFEANPCKILT
jgi:hypothetical protein